MDFNFRNFGASSVLGDGTYGYSSPDVPYLPSTGYVPEKTTNWFGDIGTGTDLTLGNNALNQTDWLSSLKSFLNGAIGTKDNPGWGGLALGTASGLANAWLGLQKYGLAKDSFDENKRQFEMNFNAQKGLTNASLEDRQRARVASNPTAYESVADYMSKYGIK